jgi:DnaJ-class molecular chaperone
MTKPDRIIFKVREMSETVEVKKCDLCKGSGNVPVDGDFPHGEIRCPKCGGTGYLP